MKYVYACTQCIVIDTRDSSAEIDATPPPLQISSWLYIPLAAGCGGWLGKSTGSYAAAQSLSPPVSRARPQPAC